MQGQLLGKCFLDLIDAHTKWLEVFQVSATTSSKHQLRTTFARFRLPHTVVINNGSCFTSEEFGTFLTKNGVHHMKTAPYHPSSNGQAECAGQVFNNGVKRLKDVTILNRLARFLFSYRYTLHSTTGLPPAKLMFGRNLHTRFDQIQPDVSARVEKQQLRQIHDSHARYLSFEVDELAGRCQHRHCCGIISWHGCH